MICDAIKSHRQCTLDCIASQRDPTSGIYIYVQYSTIKIGSTRPDRQLHSRKMAALLNSQQISATQNANEALLRPCETLRSACVYGVYLTRRNREPSLTPHQRIISAQCQVHTENAIPLCRAWISMQGTHQYGVLVAAQRRSSDAFLCFSHRGSKKL
jgi:hypothetical protein